MSYLRDEIIEAMVERQRQAGYDDQIAQRRVEEKILDQGSECVDELWSGKPEEAKPEEVEGGKPEEGGSDEEGGKPDESGKP